MKSLLACLLVLGLGACEMATAPESDPLGFRGDVEQLGPLPEGDANDSDKQQPSRPTNNGNEFLETDREVYTAGATALITLENVADEPIGANLCFTVLEVGANTGWTAAPFQQEGFCTAELRILRPGEEMTWGFRLDPRLAAGTYRFRTQIERLSNGTQIDVVSNTFEVRR